MKKMSESEIISKKIEEIYLLGDKIELIIRKLNRQLYDKINLGVLAFWLWGVSGIELHSYIQYLNNSHKIFDEYIDELLAKRDELDS